MTNIQIEVQGEDVIAATKALLAIPGVSGTYQSVEGKYKEPTLAAIATIVGIAGGTIAIAEQIRKWYQEYRQSQSGKKIEKVLIISSSGERLLLENATIEQISHILQT